MTDGAIALCQPLPISATQSSGAAPDWIQLLAAGDNKTVDGRGPYRATDLAAIAAVSLADNGDRLPIDENHATDLAAPQGGASPARGWIVALEARNDGLWGRVEWTEEGRRLMADRAYRFVSPVIRHLKDGTVTALLRAALTNTPNLRGLAALNMETSMDLLARLREALGLGRDTDEATALAAVATLKSGTAMQAIATAAGLDHGAEATAIQAAVTDLKAKADAGETALQAALRPIATAAGLKDDADAGAIEAAVRTLAAHGDGKQVTALQAELGKVAGELKALQDATARGRAETVVDTAIKAGKPGVKPLRDHYITRHMADPAAVEREFAGLPSLAGHAALPVDPPVRDGQVTALNAAQREAARLTGVPEDAMLKTVQAEATANAAA